MRAGIGIQEIIIGLSLIVLFILIGIHVFQGCSSKQVQQNDTESVIILLDTDISEDASEDCRDTDTDYLIDQVKKAIELKN
jgi:hypothetical protein